MFYRLIQVAITGLMTRVVEPYMSGHATADFLKWGVEEVRLQDGELAYMTDTGYFRFEAIK